MLILVFQKGVHVTLCMCAQCAPWTHPIPTGVPLPGRTAHRTAGINLGSVGPRHNIKGNTPNSGIAPEGSNSCLAFNLNSYKFFVLDVYTLLFNIPLHKVAISYLNASSFPPDLIGCIWLQVLPSNVQFLPSNVHFLPSNVHFLPSNVHYLPSNVHFPPPEGVSTLK